MILKSLKQIKSLIYTHIETSKDGVEDGDSESEREFDWNKVLSSKHTMMAADATWVSFSDGCINAKSGDQSELRG